MRNSKQWLTTYSVAWPLNLPLIGARGIQVLLWFSHGLASLGVLCSGIGWLLKLLCISMVIGSFYFHWRRWVVGTSKQPHRLIHQPLQGWLLQVGQLRHSVVFDSPIWLMPWFCLLSVGVIDQSQMRIVQKFTLILFPQAANREDYRRLLMLLRHAHLDGTSLPTQKDNDRMGLIRKLFYQLQKFKQA